MGAYTCNVHFLEKEMKMNRTAGVIMGALVGAQVGLEYIPQRFIDRLENGQDLVALAKKLAAQS